jgi:hypothetical protein
MLTNQMTMDGFDRWDNWLEQHRLTVIIEAEFETR